MAGSCSTHLQVNSPMFVNVVRGAPKGIPPHGLSAGLAISLYIIIGYKSSFSTPSLQVSPALNTILFITLHCTQKSGNLLLILLLL